MANHARAAFFLKPDDGDVLKSWYVGVDGCRTWRGLTGFWSRTSKRTGKTRSRRWHFAVDARPRLWSELVYFINSHVVFSDDGKTLWTQPRKMHRARRNQCKDWYNEEWRDHLLAAMSYLAQGSEQIDIPATPSECIEVSLQPIRFPSNLSFEVVKENLEAFRRSESLDEDEEDEGDDLDEPETEEEDEW